MVRRRLWIVLATLLVLALGTGAAVLYSGIYNIAATEQHTGAVHWLLDTGMRRSVAARTRDIEVPPLADAAMQRRGLALYEQHCAQCHGAPGKAPEPFALGMLPAPANLAYTARAWPARELYWVAKFGIKYSGMPAWQYRLGDDELWAIVAFLKVMPGYTTQAYAAATKSLEAVPTRGADEGTSRGSEEGDARRGRHALGQYLCATCHRIPGVVGSGAPVGPPLIDIGSRATIAGVLPNTRENMVRWLLDPQAVDPLSLMPDLGISERDAHDMAAHLATLR